MDKVKKDGTSIKDRAFSNIYIGLYNDEVLGIVKVNAKEALELFDGDKNKIEAVYLDENDKEKDQRKNITVDDFLVMDHETLTEKYGDILEEIIKITSHN